jgi:hypothetical protein
VAVERSLQSAASQLNGALARLQVHRREPATRAN